MKPVLADTFFFLAAVNPDDANHSRVIAWSNSYSGPLVTTVWILTELADALSNRKQRSIFLNLHRTLIADPRVQIIPARQIQMDRGLDLYFSRPDKDWSLTDCNSFVTMQEQDLSDALTGDHHFSQAGFNALFR